MKLCYRLHSLMSLICLLIIGVASLGTLLLYNAGSQDIVEV